VEGGEKEKGLAFQKLREQTITSPFIFFNGYDALVRREFGITDARLLIGLK